MKNQALKERRDRWVEGIVEALKPYDPEKVILFGSSARGDFDELSDFDLVIIKRTEKEFLDRLSEVARLLTTVPKSADILVYTPEEFDQMVQEGRGFILRVLEEGKVIYEKGSQG